MVYRQTLALVNTVQKQPSDVRIKLHRKVAVVGHRFFDSE